MMTSSTITAPEGRLFAGVHFREVETTDSLSMMRGRAVPYGEWANIGWFLESFAAGSLAKSIKEAARDLPLNLFHDNQMFPIGAADRWIEESGGLVGEWRLDDSEIAQRAAELAKPVEEGGKGMLTGLSIEFVPVRSTWEEAEVWDPASGPEYMDRVTREEARLCAVGLVQSPAYVSAGVQLVRSADRKRRTPAAGRAATPVLDRMRAATEALRNGAAS